MDKEETKSGDHPLDIILNSLDDNEQMNEGFYVIKRDGNRERVDLGKVSKRIRILSKGLKVNPDLITQKITDQIYPDVPTSHLDELGAQICAYQSTKHPDYGTLAARISISNHHKNTSPSFSETIEILYRNKDTLGNESPLINQELYKIVQHHKNKLNTIIKYERDYNIDYFGFMTLYRSYLLRVNNKPVERPQDMYLRVALGIHRNDFKEAIYTYELMSQGYFTHATPTLFNMGTRNEQASSCFLLAMESDSINGIYNTLKECALISKTAGGIGLAIHNVRGKNAIINGTNGRSNGIVPMLRPFDTTAEYVDQGGGKRKGSFAIYLEPWHCDIFEFIDLKKPQGSEDLRARNLFYGLWIPDLFMKRVETNEKWTLFSPDEAPGLHNVYGDKFEELYTKYEKEGRGRESIPAQKLWKRIIESQEETGGPYMLFKDHANRKSNQQNLGTIWSSNLCTEIIEYTDKDEIAVCNLASIGLPRFVNTETKEFDFEKLEEVTKVIVRNLNKIIDINYYPVDKCKTSNKKHRPIGIGVQGLADVYAMLKMPFDSKEAAEMNMKIFEHIYYASVKTSVDIAEKRDGMMIKYKELSGMLKKDLTAAQKKEKTELENVLKAIPEELERDTFLGSYSSFQNSPASKGLLQYDLWNKEPSEEMKPKFEELKERIAKYGMRNSLLLAPMPTASTAQVLGNNESCEPFTSVIYKRRTLAGEFIIVNKHLVHDLMELKLWTEELKNKIIANEGSIQQIEEIPENIRQIYKTAWDMSPRVIIDQATDRGVYICQSQSMNLWVSDLDHNKMTAMYFYAWKKGLKTGQYYLRSRRVVSAKKITISSAELSVSQTEVTSTSVSSVSSALSGGLQRSARGRRRMEDKPKEEETIPACKRDNPDCLSCGS
jgi:ribonucleoside-diphosphate reductase alpha chain